MRKIAFCVLTFVAGALAFWPGAALAGGGGGGGGLCAGFASGQTLVMRDSCFEGTAHFAAAGSTLIVQNEGGAPHSFTAVDGSFDTGLLQPGQTAQFTLGADGIVPFYCTIHGTAQGQGMAGVLIVGEPGKQSASASEPRPLGAAALGALGALLGGGGALGTVVLVRKRRNGV
jgi:hypothetical protein